MSNHRVTKFPIRRIEYVFDPLGMPLIDKVPGKPSTTVLVHGEPGAGKSTLALAIARGIADRGHGNALVYSTEAVAADVEYKLVTLGLPAPKRTADKVGESGDTLLVHRLQDDVEGAGAGSADDSTIIEGVWQACGGLEENAEGRDRVHNLKVVVVDSLPPSRDGSTVAPVDIRSQFVELAHALAARGVSLVVVEEGPSDVRQLPFAFDVVFDVGWTTSASGRYARSIQCPKVRYARSIRGPHHLGADASDLVLVPPLLDVAVRGDDSALRRTTAPSVPVPFSPGRYAVLGPGSVRSYAPLVQFDPRIPFSHQTGAKVAVVSLGAVVNVEYDSGEIRDFASEAGADAWAWSVAERPHIDYLRIEGGDNDDASTLASPVAALARLGCAVDIEHRGNAPRLDALATVVWTDRPEPSYCDGRPIARAAFQPCLREPLLAQVARALEEPTLSWRERVRQAPQNATLREWVRELRSKGAFESAIGNPLRVDLDGVVVAVQAELAVCAYRVAPALALTWGQLTRGSGDHVTRTWAALCALLARNTLALDWLLGEGFEPADPSVGLTLASLVVNDRASALQVQIQRLREPLGLDDADVRRVEWESYALAGSREGARLEHVDTIEQESQHKSERWRAEMLFNAAHVAAADNPTAAREYLNRAQALHPYAGTWAAQAVEAGVPFW